MPLLTHDETGAASMARARAVAVAERPPAPRPGGAPPTGPDRPKSTWKRVRWLWIVLGLLVIGPLLAFAIGWMLFKVPTAADAAAVQTATFTFMDGSPLAVVRPEDANGTNINRTNVTLDKVPLQVRQAVMAAEDRTFYSNPGFDVLGIARAVFSQLTGGVGGGSTITQQYVKNATGQDQSTLWRKYKEVVISVKISKEQTKDQILENYLNTIYFGRGANGIQAASQAYFGKDVGQLTVSQGAFLAGTIQSPSSKDVARSKTRWTYVVDQMVQAGWISPVERAQQVYPTLTKQSAVTGGVPSDDRYHIYDRAEAELADLNISKDQITTEGLTVTTTIDPANQKAAVDAVNKTMEGQPDNLKTALAAVDPTTGAIVAYYGGSDGLGTDYADSGVGRQPGSSFKPFVLAAALQANQGIGLGSMYDGSPNQTLARQKVTNSDGDSCAMCDVKTAMTKSINTVFYQIAIQVGPQKVVDAAHQAGIPGSQLTRQANAGVSLGDQEVHPLDMASAYGTFAADGVHHDPHIVSKVVAADGRVLFDRSTTPPPNTQAMTPQVACNVTESMTDVPTSSRIDPSGVSDVAAKTGTVQLPGTTQNKDTWTVGFTPAVSTAVWVGSNNSDPIKTKTGKSAFGVTLAGPIWKDFTSAYTKNLKDAPLAGAKFPTCDPIGTPIAPPAPAYTAPPTDTNQGGDNGQGGYLDPNSGAYNNPDGSTSGGGNNNGNGGNNNGNGGGNNGGGGGG